MSLSEDDEFMCSQCDWNEIKMLWIEMKSNDYDRKYIHVRYINDVIGIEILYDII